MILSKTDATQLVIAIQMVDGLVNELYHTNECIPLDIDTYVTLITDILYKCDPISLHRTTMICRFYKLYELIPKEHRMSEMDFRMMVFDIIMDGDQQTNFSYEFILKSIQSDFCKKIKI